MRKTYQKPSIRVRKVEIENMLAASGVSVGGNTGIGPGDGEPPTSGSAKRSSLFDEPKPSQPSSGIKW